MFNTFSADALTVDCTHNLRDTLNAREVSGVLRMTHNTDENISSPFNTESQDFGRHMVKDQRKALAIVQCGVGIKQ